MALGGGMNSIEQMVQRWREEKVPLNEGATPIQLESLERFFGGSIPADVRARISEHVWPGSSLIISDEELSKETGKATDFIVVVGDEPHGALAKRKRVPPPSNYRDYFDDDYYFSYRPSNRPYYRYERRRAPSYKGPFGWW